MEEYIFIHKNLRDYITADNGVVQLDNIKMNYL